MRTENLQMILGVELQEAQYLSGVAEGRKVQILGAAETKIIQTMMKTIETVMSELQVAFKSGTLTVSLNDLVSSILKAKSSRNCIALTFRRS